MEEKTFLILSTFEKELNEKLQKTNSQLEQVKYYEKFVIKGIEDIEFLGIFVTTEVDADGNRSINLYDGDSSHQILTVDAQNNIQITPELSMFFEEIDFQKTMEQNDKQKGRLKGISEKAEPQEIEKKLQKQPEGETEPGLEDLEIVSFREIKDDNLETELPGIFSSNADKIGCGYSKKLNAFVFAEKVNGKFQLVEEIEPAIPTFETVITINENGEKIEKKVPHALMELKNNDEKEISITIGEFGYIETGIIDVLPCNERVEMQLREDGEDINAQRTKQLEDLKTRYGQEEIHELVHKYSQELYEKNKKENNINDLQDEQRIYTSEEEEIIREEARKADISVEEFKNELMQIPDDYTLEEKIPLVHEKLEKEGPELEY